MRSPIVMVQTTRGRRTVAEDGKLGIYEMSRGIKIEYWGYLHSTTYVQVFALFYDADQ